MNMHVKPEARFEVGQRVVPSGIGEDLVAHWKSYWEEREGVYPGYFIVTHTHYGSSYDSVSYGVKANGSGPSVGTQYLKPAPLFAVGDKVRFTDKCSDRGWWFGPHTQNKEGVINSDDGCGLRYNVSVGGGYAFVSDEHIELITEPAPLTIQAGRYYKTRDGRKVGPMERYWNGDRYWSAPDALLEFSPYWCMSGAFYEGQANPYDLIAEWTDEPTAAPATFKIGDRVEFNDNQYGVDGLTGTIVADDGYHWSVKLDTYNSNYGHACDGTIAEGYGRYADSADLRLLATVPATNPAIVCLLRNGKPIPASKPYVHESVALATIEAERLAGVNTGDEFGVYELVAKRSAPKPEPVYDHEWQRLAKAGKTMQAKEALTEMAGIEFHHAASIVRDWLSRN